MAIGQYSELKTALANWSHRDDLTTRIPEFITLAEGRIAMDLKIRAMEASAELLWKAVVDGDTVGGTADAITLTPTTAATAYAYADTYKFTAASNNTGAVTVAISGLAVKDIKKRIGDAVAALSARDILSGIVYYIYYDGTQFVLIRPGAVPLPTRFVGLRRSYLDVDSGKRIRFYPSNVFWETVAVGQSAQPDIFTIEGDFIIMAPVPSGTYNAKVLYWQRFAAMSADADTNWLLTNAPMPFLFLGGPGLVFLNTLKSSLPP